MGSPPVLQHEGAPVRILLTAFPGQPAAAAAAAAATAAAVPLPHLALDPAPVERVAVDRKAEGPVRTIFIQNRKRELVLWYCSKQSQYYYSTVGPA